jgi:hypothetical protein
MQGSLLSPFLFNLFINDLITGIHENLQQQTPDIPVPPARQLMFADDIKLASSSFEVMEMMVKCCDQWAMENGMRWGIRKCAVLGLTGAEELKIGGESIPRAQQYKYLGVIFKSNQVPRYTGFDWEEHGHRLASRGRGVLSMLHNLTVELPTGMKAEMWRTFGRSSMEYAGGMVWSWYNRASKSYDREVREPARAVEEELKALHHNVLSWIAGLRASRNPIAAASLLNLPAPLERWEEMAFATQMHILKARQDNPVRRIQEHLDEREDKFALLFRPTHNLHQCLQHMTMLKEWRTARAANPNMTRRAFMRARRERKWSAPTAPMTSVFIRPPARGYADMDACTLVQSKKRREAMVKWRLGSGHGRYVCAIINCGRHGNREHDLGRECVASIDPGAMKGLYALTIEGSNAMKREKAEAWFQRFLQAHAALPDSLSRADAAKFSLLDELLNSKQHDSWWDIYKVICREKEED